MMEENTTRKSAAGMVATALNSIRNSLRRIPTARLMIHLTLETAIVMEENTTRKSAAGMVATALNSMRSIPDCKVDTSIFALETAWCVMEENTTRKSAAGMVVTALNSIR